ncbi:MAG: hypothetical protein PUH03_02795 [bacterium]|nr:hypothetical protein [bacterium]MDY2831018.1 hypothetical protein [Alphaproteobacteria bacterium]
MNKIEKAFIIALGVAMLGLISVPLGYLVTPKLEGIVSRIIENGEKTEVFFEDGKSASFSKCGEIVSLEVGDTLKYISEDGGAECWEVRSSSDRAAKRALYEQRTGVRVKGVIARIEFGYFHSFKYGDASVLFTDGETKVFSLANNPQMACAEVGDTIVYKMKKNTAHCVSLIPPATE